MSGAPIIFTYEGDGEFRSLDRFKRRCDTDFVVHEHYRMDVSDERSDATHNHYFASVHDRWMSLPDDLATQFASPEILRKHALIMTGFRRERKFVAASKEEARKLAVFLRPQFVDDDYAIISVNENVVIEWKAMSQSRKAMPEKGQFHRSKTAVLDWLDDLLGITGESPKEGVAA